MTGRTVGQYSVLDKLGSGGMGVVYEAEDTLLGRHVAIKFLPSDVGRSPGALERFLQEARSASALNHPNICTIYNVEQHDGEWMIVMELLQGRTLDQLINREPMKLDQMLDLSIQIADALETAHQHGIIHRDIKPSNIFVTHRGVAKVLDFGLAKLAVQKRSFAQTLVVTTAEAPGYLTSPGTAVGTAAYMSPEQARGEELDARTDLFSFGSVMYEMATGKLPFQGTTTAVIFANILEHEPPPALEVNPSLPPRLGEVICKALEKDRDLRCQTAGELEADLKRIRRDFGSGRVLASSHSLDAAASSSSARTLAAVPAATPAAAPPPSSTAVLAAEARRHKTGLAITAAVILAIVAALAWFLFTEEHKPKPHSSSQLMSIERLTHTGKVSGSTTISPDGRYVVYEVDNNGKLSLWLRQVATSSAVKLVPDSEDGYGATTFSRDGDFVYYTQFSREEPTGALYMVPTLGGTPKKVLSNIHSAIAFSPDGKQFTYIRESSPKGPVSELMIANADGSDPRVLYSGKIAEHWLETHGPAWSPDGKQIAAAMITIGKAGMIMGIDTFDMAGRMKTLLAKAPGEVGRLVWLRDGSAIVFTGTAKFGAFNSQLWMVTTPGGEVSRITNDLNSYGTYSLGVTSDGSALVTVQTTEHSNIWAASGNYKDPQQITHGDLDGSEGLDAAQDHVAFTTGSTGIIGIATLDLANPNPTEVTPEGQVATSPAISRDGKHVSFTFLKNRHPNIWVADFDGSNMRQLTQGNADEQSAFSADGQSVYFQHWAGGKVHIFRIPFNGGEPVQLSDLQMEYPIPSHRGDRLLVQYFDEKISHWKVGVISASDGKLLQTLEFSLLNGNVPAWMPGDEQIVYGETHDGVSNLYTMPVAGGPSTQMTHFMSEQIFNSVVTPDGKLVMARGHNDSDAILIRNFR